MLPVWELEDEVSELHAFEMRTLSAGSIHKHPLLINIIYSCDQLSRMGPKGNVGHPANLHVTPEHHVGGAQREAWGTLLISVIGRQRQAEPNEFQVYTGSSRTGRAISNETLPQKKKKKKGGHGQ